MSDETRCSICGAEATENAKGRLEMRHDWARHQMAATSVTPVTPLRRPERTGAWGDQDD